MGKKEARRPGRRINEIYRGHSFVKHKWCRKNRAQNERVQLRGDS